MSRASAVASLLLGAGAIVRPAEAESEFNDAVQRAMSALQTIEADVGSHAPPAGPWNWSVGNPSALSRDIARWHLEIRSLEEVLDSPSVRAMCTVDGQELRPILPVKVGSFTPSLSLSRIAGYLMCGKAVELARERGADAVGCVQSLERALVLVRLTGNENEPISIGVRAALESTLTEAVPYCLRDGVVSHEEIMKVLFDGDLGLGRAGPEEGESGGHCVCANGADEELETGWLHGMDYRAALVKWSLRLSGRQRREWPVEAAKEDLSSLCSSTLVSFTMMEDGLRVQTDSLNRHNRVIVDWLYPVAHGGD